MYPYTIKTGIIEMMTSKVLDQSLNVPHTLYTMIGYESRGRKFAKKLLNTKL